MNDELIGIVRFYTKKEKTLCRIYLSVHKKNSFVFPENHVIPNILQRPPPLPPPPPINIDLSLTKQQTRC